MKLILGTIVGGVIQFLIGGLVYMVILADFYSKHFQLLYRPVYDFKMWAIIVGCVTYAFFLSLIYPKGYKGGSPVSEGMKFGIYIGLLMSVPYVFFFWASYKVSYVGIAVDGIVGLISTIITCIAIALIYGKSVQQT